jgi:hypothetical protein
MRVTELFEDEADLPLIYDIIKAKLDNNIPLRLVNHPTLTVACKIETSEVGGFHVNLWWRYFNLARPTSQPRMEAGQFEPADLEHWKLKKNGFHWELET